VIGVADDKRVVVVGGRKNGKAYKAAVAEFDEKFDEEE